MRSAGKAFAGDGGSDEIHESVYSSADEELAAGRIGKTRSRVDDRKSIGRVVETRAPRILATGKHDPEWFEIHLVRGNARRSDCRDAQPFDSGAGLVRRVVDAVAKKIQFVAAAWWRLIAQHEGRLWQDAGQLQQRDVESAGVRIVLRVRNHGRHRVRRGIQEQVRARDKCVRRRADHTVSGGQNPAWGDQNAGTNRIAIESDGTNGGPKGGGGTADYMGKALRAGDVARASENQARADGKADSEIIH